MCTNKQIDKTLSDGKIYVNLKWEQPAFGLFPLL